MYMDPTSPSFHQRKALAASRIASRFSLALKSAHLCYSRSLALLPNWEVITCLLSATLVVAPLPVSVWVIECVVSDGSGFPSGTS